MTEILPIFYKDNVSFRKHWQEFGVHNTLEYVWKLPEIQFHLSGWLRIVEVIYSKLKVIRKCYFFVVCQELPVAVTTYFHVHYELVGVLSLHLFTLTVVSLIGQSAPPMLFERVFGSFQVERYLKWMPFVALNVWERCICEALEVVFVIKI